MKRVIPEGIYLCRSRREVAIVHRRMLGPGPFAYLVEYAPESGVTYAEPALGKVNERGFVWGAEQPDERDLVEFIEFYNPEGDIVQ